MSLINTSEAGLPARPADYPADSRTHPAITDAKPARSVGVNTVCRNRNEVSVATTGSIAESMLAFYAPQSPTPLRYSPNPNAVPTVTMKAIQSIVTILVSVRTLASPDTANSTRPPMSIA